MDGKHRTWHIPARPEAVAEARRATRKALADWGCAHAIDDLMVVVSELVTNAIAHGEPPITLTLCLDLDHVHGTVIDHGPTLPRPVFTGDLTECGRGLPLVADLTRTLAWKRIPGGGKRVSFTYLLPEKQ
ncbi:ATP-binding protein [Thermopolyspora sp. NPDC052614]|uniref:ATP-binding protein n=1 Tax=Thermopolyspora sp. NPDC052614 TaxID=3155682 RepID=UPI003445FF1B